ncbi:MAG: regulatory protein RecX [Mangrovibacterium sp.]
MTFNKQQQEAYERAAVLCSRAEKSPGSIRKKMLDWGLPEEETAPVLSKLKEENFINPSRFVRSYVHDKFHFNRWGKIKITWHLKAEEIPGSLIREALGEITAEAYKNCLRILLKEKSKGIKAAGRYERKAKLFRFALSRGFEPDVIRAVIGKTEED